MKNKLRQLYDLSSLSKANFIILALYLWFILGTSLFLYTLSLPRVVFLILLLALLILSLFLSPVILNLIRKRHLPDAGTLRHKNALRTTREKIIWALFFFAVSFGIFLLYYIAYYPGGFSNDSVNQYEQAMSDSYSDWHPALHTFLVFTLPLKLSGGNIAWLTFFQILYFSLILTYAFYVLRGYAGKTFSVISFFIVILNPATTRMAMYPWKDVTFAITALWLFTFVLQIMMTDGVWLHSPLHIILFAVVWAGTTIFRHNAVLLTAPLLIGIFLYGLRFVRLSDTVPCKRLCGLITCILSILVLLLIKGPFYAALDVEKPGGRQLETLGLPLTVICDVRAADPDTLDTETRAFADLLADDNVWADYTLGSYGGIKWQSHYDVVDDVPASDILRMTLNCFRRSPTVSTAAVIRLTDMVYTVSQGIDWAIDVPMVWPNEIGHTGNGNAFIASILEKYFSVSLSLPRLIFYYIGILNLVLMICLIAFHRWKERESWKRFFLVAPVFCYNFGTMLLLTNNDFRLFYYCFLVTPLLLFMLLVKHEAA